MGGGDQQRAIRRDEAALDRARGLHQLGGEHDVDVARHGHERKHRLTSGGLRGRFGKQFDIIDRGAGALRDARYRGRLREIAAVLGEIDDPVGQHATTLAAERDNGNGDRPHVRDLRLPLGFHLYCQAAARSMRRCSQPMTAPRTLFFSRSQCEGLAMIEAR